MILNRLVYNMENTLEKFVLKIVCYIIQYLQSCNVFHYKKERVLMYFYARVAEIPGYLQYL